MGLMMLRFSLTATATNLKQLVLAGRDVKTGCKNVFRFAFHPKTGIFDRTSLEWKMEPKSENGTNRKGVSWKAERFKAGIIYQNPGFWRGNRKSFPGLLKKSFRVYSALFPGWPIPAFRFMARREITSADVRRHW
jgi:hypothetical protein